MNSDRELKKETTVEPNATTPSTYQYRWNYGDQCAYENAQTQKKRRHGAWVYAIVMTLVFAVCIGLLAGVIIFYGTDTGGMTTAQVSEIVSPATVLIYSSSTTGAGYGTGFFIRPNGYIATNYHVVKGGEQITVTLYSGEELEAKLVNFSEADDLAVLKVKDGTYPTVMIGDSDMISVGDVAIAIGNPSGTTASWTTTQGIISALDREVTVTQTGRIEELTMIQTDAPVNPGNSGGPLCNDRGEVIGIVTRKLTDYEGIGLAIPINGAMEILDAIVDKGSADGVQSSISKVRPTIGISVLDVEEGRNYEVWVDHTFTAQKTGILVVEVDQNGAAYGKLQAGDIITAMDGVTVRNQEDLKTELYKHSVGDRVEITVWRNGQSTTVAITLGKA